MTEATRKAAIVKLHAITNNVGYPKKWRDYSKVSIVRDDLLGNSVRTAEAMYDQRIVKIGQPTDKTEWYMTTPTVNAFYSPQNNSINFPAGILQPPFFDPQRDIAMNYGGIGAVIGHEMTHGFDDQGRKFDAGGNLRDWWTPQDGAEFEKRAACIADEHSSFTAVDDVKLNGRLTLGENTADNGGVRVALMALDDTLKGNEDKVEGYTPETALLPGIRAGMVREHVAAGIAPAGHDRSALARPLPRERHGGEHARVPEGVLLQSWPADGERQRLPGVVTGRHRHFGPERRYYLDNMNPDSSRRNFLRVGLTLPAIGLAGARPSAAFEAPSSIPYRTLGKTGLKVCPVGFGSGFTPEPSIIARAVDLGVNYFDTAIDYANGNSERLVTQGLKGVPRDKVIVVSKTPARTAESSCPISRPASRTWRPTGSISGSSTAEASPRRFPTSCSKPAARPRSRGRSASSA